MPEHTDNLFCLYSSPVGLLKIERTKQGICGLYFLKDHPVPPHRAAPDHPLLQQAVQELDEYFAGRRTVFTVPLAPEGTPFQLTV